ncbi:hypothetical protein P3T76_016027 [Phytophthora citrophthora]|uniref:Uncharacterized protein n=1 Tax=Phytophthora citrophthora TaxID=4793 RepID=A0AAD9FY97_9STRA|nr:hypothetical protein P3T76_016027 [Phytophthora citrophthora]
MTTSSSRPAELIAPHIFEKLLGHQRSLALTSCADESLEWTYVALLRRAFALRDELLTTSNLALNSLELVGRRILSFSGPFGWRHCRASPPSVSCR